MALSTPARGWTQDPTLIKAISVAFPKRSLRIALSRLLTTGQIQECVAATLSGIEQGEHPTLWDVALEKGHISKQQLDQELRAVGGGSEDDRGESEEVLAKLSRRLSREQLGEALTAQLALARFGIDKSLLDIAEAKGFSEPESGQGIGDSDPSTVRVERADDTGPPQVPGYEILNPIGRGGMSTVYRARQLSMDRVVALKILEEDRVRSEGFVQRFAKEARLAAGLNHPNIVMAIDYGRSGRFYYFVMEFVDGEAVSSIIRRKARLPETAALYITAQVARALEHARQHGLIHRDIKPGNILITRNGVVKLADLGLAKKVHTHQQEEQEVTSLTDAMVAVGTPQYISPEQAKGLENIDTRADIYSLGITLFTMLSGRFPFDGPPMEVIAKQITEPVPPIRSVAPSVSERTNSIIRKMTAKLPEKRYQTPHELLGDLMDALESLYPPDKNRPFWMEDHDGFPEPLAGIFDDAPVGKPTDFVVYEDGVKEEFDVEPDTPVVKKPEDEDGFGHAAADFAKIVGQPVAAGESPGPESQSDEDEGLLLDSSDDSNITMHSEEEFPELAATLGELQDNPDQFESREDGFDGLVDDSAQPLTGTEVEEQAPEEETNLQDVSADSDSDFSPSLGLSGVMDQLVPGEGPAVNMIDRQAEPAQDEAPTPPSDSDSSTGISELMASLKEGDFGEGEDGVPDRTQTMQADPGAPAPAPGYAAGMEQPAPVQRSQGPRVGPSEKPYRRRTLGGGGDLERARVEPQPEEESSFGEPFDEFLDTGPQRPEMTEAIEPPAPAPTSKRGYRMEAVSGLHAGVTFGVAEGSEVVIGRDKRWSEIVLADPRVSRYHCLLNCAGSKLLLQDHRSHNGTFVNGRRINTCTLREGDQVRIGKTIFVVRKTGA